MGLFWGEVDILTNTALIIVDVYMYVVYNNV